MTVSGCTGGTESGTPTVPSQPAVSTSTVPTASPTGGVHRPAALPLDDVRPCDLFTEQMRQEFGLRESSMPDVDSAGQQTCQMLAGPPGGYIITAVTNEGMERFDGIPEELATVRRLDVAGFAAAELRDQHQPSACLIGIDIADGQHLSVYVSDVPENGTPDEICDNAVKFAEFAMASLRQQLER